MNLKRARGFTVVSLLLPCVLPGLQTGCTTHRPTAAQLQPLQGTWEESKAGEKVTVTITGNSLDFHRDSNFWFKTRFTLPTGKDPQQLHATIKGSSPPEDSKGKVVVAIFKIEDGTLTLAAEPQNGSKAFEGSWENRPSGLTSGMWKRKPSRLTAPHLDSTRDVPQTPEGSTSGKKCRSIPIQVNLKVRGEAKRMILDTPSILSDAIASHGAPIPTETLATRHPQE